MAQPWIEPTLQDLLNDPILGLLLAYDGLSREDLGRAIERGRQALARRGPRLSPPPEAYAEEKKILPAWKVELSCGLAAWRQDFA